MNCCRTREAIIALAASDPPAVVIMDVVGVEGELLNWSRSEPMFPAMSRCSKFFDEELTPTFSRAEMSFALS